MATGRPTKFDAEKGRRICECLKAGADRKAAAGSVGVHYHTFLRWLEKGREAKSGPFREFLDAVSQAEEECAVRNAAILNKAANGWDSGGRTRTVKTVFRTRKTRHPDGTVTEEPVALEEVTETETITREFDWRAALEWLKRRRREDWSEKTISEVSGPDGGPLQIQHEFEELRKLPADELLRLHREALGN